MTSYTENYSDYAEYLIDFIKSHSNLFNEIITQFPYWQHCIKYNDFEFYEKIISVANELNKQFNDNRVQDYIDTLIDVWEV